MSKFSDFIDAIEGGVKELAKQTLKGFKEDALDDAKQFLGSSEDDLKRWSKLLAQGKLSEHDFEWLVMGKKDVIELLKLKQSGLALVRLDRFKSALLNLVIDTALDIFP